eukprot:352550-Chlamydomonas_euryale.AAC.18
MFCNPMSSLPHLAGRWPGLPTACLSDLHSTMEHSPRSMTTSALTPPSLAKRRSYGSPSEFANATARIHALARHTLKLTAVSEPVPKEESRQMSPPRSWAPEASTFWPKYKSMFAMLKIQLGPCSVCAKGRQVNKCNSPPVLSDCATHCGGSA